MMGKNIFIFDIDGVLLEPKGYRKSFCDTVNSYLIQFGFDDCLVDDNVAELYEKYGIPAEWDMVPLTLAAFFNWYAQYADADLPAFVLDEIQSLPKIHAPIDFLDFLPSQVEAYHQVLLPTCSPPESVLRAVDQSKDGSPLCFLHHHPLIDDLLHNSLDYVRNTCFRRLELFILGTDLFETTFQTNVPQGIKSNLICEDTPILSAKNAQEIAKKNQLISYAAVMTARPNRIPANFPKLDSRWIPSIPEGDLILDLFNWKQAQIPVVGVGVMGYLEVLENQYHDAFSKPHPLHALTAICSAFTTDLYHAATVALSCWRHNERHIFHDELLYNLIPLDESFNLTVFEDSPSGIRSVEEAAQLLTRFGYALSVFKVGIRTTSEKAMQLKALGAEIFDDVNQALEYIGFC